MEFPGVFGQWEFHNENLYERIRFVLNWCRENVSEIARGKKWNIDLRVKEMHKSEDIDAHVSEGMGPKRIYTSMSKNKIERWKNNKRKKIIGVKTMRAGANQNEKNLKKSNAQQIQYTK